MTNLRAIRTKKGFTQVEVAKALGISKQAYGKYELGKSQASYETLLKLAEFLDSSVEEIIQGPDITPYKMPDTEPPTNTNSIYKMLDDEKKTVPVELTLDGITKVLSGLSESELDELMLYVDFLEYKRTHSSD